MDEGPATAALRQLRAERVRLQRRMLPAAFAAMGVLAYLSASKPPHLGLHGKSLALTVALTGFVAAAIGARQVLLVAQYTVPRKYAPVLVLLVATSSVLVWVQPGGPGLTGYAITLVLVVVGRVVPSRIGVVLLAVATLAVLFTVVLLGEHGDHSRWGTGLLTATPFLVAFAAATLVWRLRRQQQQTERLLAQLDASRGAELRAAALAERQRLAREMHDVLAHSLSGLVLQLEGARLLAVSDPGDPRLAETIDRAHQLAKSGLTEARQAIGVLRDDALPGPGGLSALTSAFTEDTGIACAFTEVGEPRELASAVRLALYRVTQEALTNVRKHAARPERVDVRLTYAGDEATLVVADGAGTGDQESRPQLDAPGGGYGLTGMRERAELLGGTLSAGPVPGGFRVELRVPTGDRA